MEKIGIIDLGSNTARLLIVNMFAEGHYMVVDELKESVRLGQDMDRDGFLKPQRIAETIKTLKMFKRLCDASGVERIIAVGTAAVRRAKNQRSFLDEIQVSCNITIRVLSEEEEALLVYRGVINSMDIPKGLILEIGGVTVGGPQDLWEAVEVCKESSTVTVKVFRGSSELELQLQLE